MIKSLSKWTDHPKNYWNLMSIFFWYKNAALIEKQHPMVAGFFRLKDRKSPPARLRRRLASRASVEARQRNHCAA